MQNGLRRGGYSWLQNAKEKDVYRQYCNWLKLPVLLL